MRLLSLFSFSSLPVTLVTIIIYLIIAIPTIFIHETVPSPPIDSQKYKDINITEALYDLDKLSNGYHPFNSHRNDEVRNWLLLKIGRILNDSDVNWVLKKNSPKAESYNWIRSSDRKNDIIEDKQDSSSKNLLSEVVVFDDLVANFTNTELTSILNNGRKAGTSTYFEGSNIIVYIRGSEDKSGAWWEPLPPYTKHQPATRGVMVNSHFDSVSTGYGATDDGVGVITGLQLIRYFTAKGNQPERGIVFLFNNNEEDGLYGAKTFICHEMASFVDKFLNLEGAGAGGRATLFRSTDLEVTQAYSHSPYPFGTVISADGFSLGLIKSETDYAVFRARGYRGLDVAFWQPRSRYHTDQDDTKHTSKASIWHMLSASVETVKYLTTDENFAVNLQGYNLAIGEKDGKKTDGVWFDIFGRFFAVFGLRTLFAWSLSLLITTPLILLIISYLLLCHDKYYLFTTAIKPNQKINEWISLCGWHGAFRFPVALMFSSTLTVGGAFLIGNVNPLIIYSSQYSVWSMFLSFFFCVFWILLAGSNKIRPSALHKTYVLIWMFILEWGFLIVVTISEDRFQISSGYIFVFNHGAIFLATLIGLCELSTLPPKSLVVESVNDESQNFNASNPIPDQETHGSIVQDMHNHQEEILSSEVTPLISGSVHQSLTGTTFSRGYRRSNSHQHESFQYQMDENQIHFFEKKLSAKFPSWTWLLQFIILVPFPLILIGQVGLLIVSATSQTGTDGSSLLAPYLIVAIFSILLILPLAPFIHQIKYQVPAFFFLIFIGTLVYNLVAFPFSAQNRFKTFFQQTVDLDNGSNRVTLVGIEEYTRELISQIPSAASQLIVCTACSGTRKGLSSCSYNGIVPNNIPLIEKSNLTKNNYENWLNYNVTRIINKNKATFRISGRETKSCAIRFDLPFTAFHVYGSTPQKNYWDDIPDTGSDEIKLWHRDWDRTWEIDVEWPVSGGKNPGDEGRSGKIVCKWNDHSIPGIIPALDEIEMFAPAWATTVKLTDGLIEGSKNFVI